MEQYQQSAEKLKDIWQQIAQRQELWKELKLKLSETLDRIGKESGLDYILIVTDHIENWESVSFKLTDITFSNYIKGNKKQPVIKQGGSLVYGLMPSGFVKAGMVFPRINEIKEKEISFLTFEIIKELKLLTESHIKEHLNRFIKEITDWELGEGGDIRERIGFKANK